MDSCTFVLCTKNAYISWLCQENVEATDTIGVCPIPASKPQFYRGLASEPEVSER